MITHQLTQGSPEWLAYRAQHFNASDAPAMLGCSPHKTRAQLLHELHTGIPPEVDAATQRRFDEGHRIEALARPLAESIIGQDLFPTVGSEGELSASFDGLTLCETIAWEHKTLNAELLAAFEQIETIAPEHRDRAGGAELPLHYRVQMEQQMRVSGATRVLFTASEWQGDTPVDVRHCWVHPDPALRADIVRGWQQFADDLAAYTPPVPKASAVGYAPQALPALRIEVTGMVTHSNLDAFKAHALSVFGGINRDLKTDSDFADAEATVKWCADVESRLAAAKQHAMSQMHSIDALYSTIDDISALSRRVRLELDKLVKAQKESIRDGIVTAGACALRNHIAGLNQRIGKPMMLAVPADFAGAIKGKRTLESLQNAVDTELARAKIAASEVADRIQINLQRLQEHQALAFLFPDVAALVLKQPDDLAAAVDSRVADHQRKEAARIEAERERIRAEETRKLLREQEEARMAAEAEQLAQATPPAPTPTAPAIATPAPAPQAQRPPDNVVPLQRHAAAPTLKLGDIAQRLGFTLTADFVAGLGFKPAATDRASKLYHEADFALMLAALVRHIQAIQARAAA